MVVPPGLTVLAVTNGLLLLAISGRSLTSISTEVGASVVPPSLVTATVYSPLVLVLAWKL